MRRTIKWSMICLFLLGMSFFPSYALEKPKEIGWRILQGLDYRTGKISDEVSELNGKIIRLPGFIVPLYGDENSITEFLLVPSFGYCVHVPPPPPNLTIYVLMPQGVSPDLMFYPVWITGKLQIATTKRNVPGTNYTPEASYTLHGTEAETYKYE